MNTSHNKNNNTLHWISQSSTFMGGILLGILIVITGGFVSAALITQNNSGVAGSLQHGNQLVEASEDALISISGWNAMSNGIIELHNRTRNISVHDTSGHMSFGGRIGIGTTDPTVKLDVNGHIATSQNLYVSEDINSKNLYIAGKIGIGTNNPDQKLTVYGNIATSQNLYVSGNVGVGTNSPSSKLHVMGTITETSDERLKENILPVENALEKITQIQGVSFTWKDTKKMDSKTHLGLTAQNVEEIFPELVYTATDEMGTKSVNYDGMIAPLVESVKELKAENELFKAENTLLKKALCEEFSEKNICQ